MDYVATVAGVTYDLQGRLYKSTAPPAGGHALYPAVILNHGFNGNVNGYSAQIAHTMVTWGLVCIMTNLTHAGGVPLGSPGLATELGSSASNVLRNRKCVDLLQSLGYVDLRRLAAHGHSMGAFANGALLGTHHDLFLVGSHTAGGMSTQPGDIATTAAQAQAITAPYQIHHGDADTEVPLATSSARCEAGGEVASRAQPRRVVPHVPGKRRRGRRRHSWAELLRRVFLIEVLVCPRCGGARRLLAAIHDPESIRRVLGSLGLSAEVPAMCPARSPPRQQELEWE